MNNPAQVLELCLCFGLPGTCKQAPFHIRNGLVAAAASCRNMRMHCQHQNRTPEAGAPISRYAQRPLKGGTSSLPNDQAGRGRHDALSASPHSGSSDRQAGSLCHQRWQRPVGSARTEENSPATVRRGMRVRIQEPRGPAHRRVARCAVFSQIHRSCSGTSARAFVGSARCTTWAEACWRSAFRHPRGTAARRSGACLLAAPLSLCSDLAAR
jgi:hypothetical protein